MSGTSQYLDGGYTKIPERELQPPSPAIQAEALRRHQEGDTTPLRSDGDLSFTPFVGKRIAPRGIWEGASPDQRIDNPRVVLRLALGERDALSDDMRRLGAGVQAAEAACARAQGALDAISNTARHALSVWADGDRTLPAPVHTEQTKVEQAAIVLAEQRKLAVLQDASKQAEAVYLEQAEAVGQKVAIALAAVAYEVADELKARRQQRTIQNAEDRAVLLGLAKYFKATGNGHAAALVERPTDPTNQWRRAMLPKLEAIEQDASRFPDRLLRDPGAEL